jgi:hypothetical protein
MYTFITQSGEIYKSSKQINKTDIRVPSKPSSEHYWVDGEWILRGDRRKWLNEHIRPERDRLLSETMWIAERQSTAPLENRMSSEHYKLWIKYWQDLRDLPETIDAENPSFPEMPEIDWTGGAEEDPTPEVSPVKRNVFKRILGMR